VYTLEKTNTSPLCILRMLVPQITPLLTLTLVHMEYEKSPPPRGDVATTMNYGVASFMSWSKSSWNLETSIMKIKEPPTTTTFFWRWTPCMGADKPIETCLPKGKPIGSRMVDWKCMVHPDAPTMIGWTVGVKVHWKATHPSTILTWSDLTSKFPWDIGWGLGFKPPFQAT
jgi:hypothetical protein